MGPAWLPDSTHLVFRTRAGGFLDLYERALDGEGGNTLLVKSDTDKEATSASPDGRFLAFRSAAADTGFDIWMLSLKGGGRPFPFLHSRFNENNARFSPDGRWVAYESDESERDEVYVVSFPQAAEKLRVSADGGHLPRWSQDGKELYFLTTDNSALMAAPVTHKGAGLQIGTPERLFQEPFMSSGGYDVWNGRFLFASEQGILQRSPLTLVENWPELTTRAGAR
jgi:Tol biopolymer transport system component